MVMIGTSRDKTSKLTIDRPSSRNVGTTPQALSVKDESSASILTLAFMQKVWFFTSLAKGPFHSVYKYMWRQANIV